tara:strand:+ start:10009 stop:11118 length:1110 start_codon:yes stop_codon:yes gene_type:complete
MKKNVIMICIDGGRLDRAISSNTFNSISSNGIFFPQTITYAPYTNSSIHAMISGSYGNHNGCSSYWHSLKFKKNHFKTLTEYLHDNNFYTFADVHSYLILPKIGFDEYQTFDESSVDLISRHKEILTTLKNKNKNFFLYLHYSEIHTGIRDEVLKKYTNFDKEYFDKKKENEERYDLLFKKAENYVENIFNEISKLSLFKNSIIILFSDHGISIGEKYGERAYGAYCYDYTIKTFSYYLTDDFENKQIHTQIRHIDFLPTILDHLGIKPDSNFQSIDGVSLIPLISGNSFTEELAYTETANPLKENSPPKIPNTKSVRTSKWKFILNEYDSSTELYDLENDPSESKNLSGSNLKIEQELSEKLNQLQKS